MSTGTVPKNKNLQKLIIEDYFQTTFGSHLKNEKAPFCFMDILRVAVEHAHGDVRRAKKTLLECNLNQLQISETEKILRHINENYKKNILIKTDIYVKKLCTVIPESSCIQSNKTTQKNVAKAISLLHSEKSSFPIQPMEKKVVTCFRDAMNAVYKNENVSYYFTKLCAEIKFTEAQAIEMGEIWEWIYKLPNKELAFTDEIRTECMKKICEILNFQYCSWYV
jgi:hypothetical protein